MARGAQKQANTLFNESQGAFNTAQNNANSLYNQMFPQYEHMATNPQGYSMADLNAMNTADQQSLGGATAGALGEGNLEAARTRNAGAFAPALDEAVRSGQRQLSRNALGIQKANADLKQKNQEEGLAGLSDLYGSNQDALRGALGLGNSAVNTNVNAGRSGWLQNFEGIMSSLGGGGGVAAMKKAF